MDRILLIEDEIGAIAALKRALGRAGFEVLVATNGPDALSMARSGAPRAIVLSADLQGGAVEELRQGILALIEAPIVVVGGAAGADEARLSRPVDGALLAERLREALSGAEPPPRANGEDALAARRSLLSAREAAERAAREKAEAAAKAAHERQEEARRRRTPTPAPPLKPTEATFQAPVEAPLPADSPLAQELFGDLPAEEKPVAAVAALAPLVPAPPAPVRETGSEPPSPTEPPKPPASPTETPPTPAVSPGRGEGSPALQAAPPFPLPKAGTLAEVEPAHLLAACHRAHWTGRLSLREGNVARHLFWESGRLCGAESTSIEERLELLAYRRGLLTREQQRQVRADGIPGSRRTALALVERAYLKPAELFPLVQERVEEIAFAACGCLTGHYEIDESPVPPDERVVLARSPLALLTEGIRRKYRLERIVDALGGPATLLRPIEDGGPDLGAFGLTAQERRLAEAVDGLRNVEELLFETGREPLSGLQILHALCLGGFLEIAVRGLPAELGSDLHRAIDAGRIAEKSLQVREASYFDLLGIETSATRHEVERAYARLAAEFDPTRLALDDPRLRAQVDEIGRVLAEARDILSDDGLRAQYARHRRPKGSG
ncbi:MAG: DUF4388 domain-containing protein [Deltaproteobacteria bacterium]